MKLEAFKKETDLLIQEVLESYPTWGRLPDFPVFVFNNDGTCVSYLIESEAREACTEPELMMAAMRKMFADDKQVYGVLYCVELSIAIKRIDAKEDIVKTMQDPDAVKAMADRAQKSLVAYRETRHGFRDGFFRIIVREEGKPVRLVEPKEIAEARARGADTNNMFKHFPLSTFEDKKSE